jgi:hypothetical protein
MLRDTSPNGGELTDDAMRSRPGRHRASRRQRRQVSQPSRYQPATLHRQSEDGRQVRQTPRRALPIAAAAAGVLSIGAAAAGAGWFLFLPQGQSPTAAGAHEPPAGASLSRGAGVPSLGDGTSRPPTSAQPGTPGLVDSVGPTQSSEPRTSAVTKERAPKQEDRGRRTLPRPTPTFQTPDELDPESSSSPEPESPSPTASSPEDDSPTSPAPDSPSPTAEPEPTSPTPTSTSDPIVDIDLDLPLPDLGLPIVN